MIQSPESPDASIDRGILDNYGLIYTSVFIIFFIAWGVGTAWKRFILFSVVCDDPLMAQVASIGGAAGACTVITIGFLEVFSVMVLANRLIRKRIKEIQEEARAEAQAEVERLWGFINRAGLQVPPAEAQDEPSN